MCEGRVVVPSGPLERGRDPAASVRLVSRESRRHNGRDAAHARVWIGAQHQEGPLEQLLALVPELRQRREG